MTECIVTVILSVLILSIVGAGLKNNLYNRILVLPYTYVDHSLYIVFLGPQKGLLRHCNLGMTQQTLNIAGNPRYVGLGLDPIQGAPHFCSLCPLGLDPHCLHPCAVYMVKKWRKDFSLLLPFCAS